ncbi:MAG: polysaccharide biosynthesis tyrosine autokinase [bacterium]|nr:polysaccharide biosynthesis tyrosine autokinase [bacterium]
MENNKVNTSSNDTSFLDDDANSGFKFKDLLFLVLRNLHWFILCAAICGLYSYYKVRNQERIYASSASIMIKMAVSGGSDTYRGSSAISAITGQGVAISSVQNEMMVLKSQTNMENMVRKLNLNTMYSYKTKIAKRNKDLYKSSPIEVTFPDMEEEASASFMVRPIDNNYVMLEDIGGNVPSMKVKLNDTVMIPQGRMVVTPTWIYKDFINTPIKVNRRPLSAVASSYRGRIGVRRDNDRNSILRLSLRDTSPLRAADALNTLIDVYNQESIDDQQRILDYSEAFINDRINYLMTDIKDYEQVFVDFKRSHNLIDTKSFGQTYVASSAASTEEAKKLRDQAGNVRFLINFIENNEGELIPIGAVNVGAEATSIIKKYNDNQTTLEGYRSDGTMNNPVAVNLLESQKTLRSSILVVLQTNLQGLESRIDAADRERSIANAQIQSVPTAQLELNEVGRMQNIKEKLYLQLLTKREELLLTSPQLEATSRVIDYAQPNLKPVAPDEKKNVMTGILIGLAIPAVIMLLRKLLDTSVHDRADVQKSTTAPFLGDVPYEKGLEAHSIVVRENGRDSLSESFRLIRSSLEYMKDRKEGAHVIMFSSFMVSSGKTFVSSNLAGSFAFASRKTVLVDLDIRKGTLSKVFDSNVKVGVYNYLSGKTDNIDDIIHSDPNIPNLDIIFAGPIPPNPAELLMSTRLDDMIAELRKRYEYIFLDNVPVGMVADSDIVKRVADTTIFVLRAGKTDKRLLFDVDKFYKDGKFPNLCIVLNSVAKKKRGYGYYGYGYGYGYGSDEEKKKKKWYQRLFKKDKHHHHHHHSSSSKSLNKDDGKD